METIKRNTKRWWPAVASMIRYALLTQATSIYQWLEVVTPRWDQLTQLDWTKFYVNQFILLLGTIGAIMNDKWHRARVGETEKVGPKYVQPILLVLLLLFVMSGNAQTVRSFKTVSEMDTNTPARTEFISEVSGFYTVGDISGPQKYRYDFTNALTTNGIIRSVPNGIGRRILLGWNGDPRMTGAKFSGSTTNDAELNQAAINAAISASRTLGIPLVFPPGTCHVLGDFDVSGVSGLTGTSSGPGGIETEFIICQKGASLFVNVSSGTIIGGFKSKPLFLSWFRDDTTSSIITTANSTYAIKIKDIEGWSYKGLQLNGWDYSVEDCDIWGAQGINFPTGGTQSDVKRVAIRSVIMACSTNSNTAITIPSYTAGSTNFTVSDGEPLRVGDIIMSAAWTAPNYSNALQGKTWGRRITAVSGNDITIDQPWPTSFVNGLVYYLLGSGLSGVFTLAENQFQNLNVEYGAWDHAINCVVGSQNFDSVHIEGWMIYRPGVTVALFGGNQAAVTIGKLEVVNCVTLDATTVSLFDLNNSYDVGVISIRDVDMFQANRTWHVSAGRSLTRPHRIRVGAINNYGVPLADLDPGFWQMQGSTYMAGDQMALQQRVGTRNMHFYDYTSVPTVGSFVTGDRIYLPNETLQVTASGTLGTPLGQFKIRTGSRVLVTDSTGRGYIGDRTAIDIGGVTYVAQKPAMGGVVTMTVASNAPAGARDLWVNSAVGLIGDWAILTHTNGTTYEDIRFQRLHQSGSPQRVHLSLPTTNAYPAGSTIESGVYLDSASWTNVAALQNIVYATPQFSQEVRYSPAAATNFTSAPFVISNSVVFPGSVTMGQASAFNVLRVIGGSTGARPILLDRVGVATNGIGVGPGSFSFYENETMSSVRGIMAFNADATTVSLTGGAVPFNTTHGRDFFIRPAPALAGGTDLNGGDTRIFGGEGTGLGDTGDILFALGSKNTTNSTATHNVTNFFILRTPPWNGTLSNTAVLLPYFTTNNTFGQLRMVLTNKGAGYLEPIFVP